MWAVNFSLSFLRGGSRSPLPIFGPSGLIEGIHISKNCQNNYQSCLDFSSLLCLNIACTIFNQAKFSHHHFCRGVTPFLATPTSFRIWSRFTFQLEFLLIIFADWSHSPAPVYGPWYLKMTTNVADRIKDFYLYQFFSFKFLPYLSFLSLSSPFVPLMKSWLRTYSNLVPP